MESPLTPGVLAGFVISILGAILLVTGGTGIFAGELHPQLTLTPVLFALGGLISLAGTGFLMYVFS